uniref:Nuclear Testis protein N-terminal domain-containing protein n=1 Tax=Naja naja TaxID=35670 RepID=A0A8C6XIM3_NAJNA
MASQNHTQGPGLSPCPPNVPSLLLPTFPGAALLVTSADTPGSKLIIKLKREGPLVGGSEELPRTQTFFLTGMPLGWATQRRDGPGGPGIRTVLLTKAGEEPGGRKTRAPEAIPSAQGSPSNDTSFACTSKGVYENYRRWQRYKALARRHFPATPDAEALACFFIPVLRSLARLRPNMTLEDGVPRAVQEWEHSSNFERMIFYEMAEKFMEFEAEEEQQIQKMKLLATCSQFQNPVPKPTKLPMSPVPESGQQQGTVYPRDIKLKAREPDPAHRVLISAREAALETAKDWPPRRRQRRPPSTSNPGAPREIPAEAVHQYAEIMEGLNPSWEEEEAEKKEHGMCRDAQDQEEGVFPDPGLLQYIDQLCDDEEFVCKVTKNGPMIERLMVLPQAPNGPRKVPGGTGVLPYILGPQLCRGPDGSLATGGGGGPRQSCPHAATYPVQIPGGSLVHWGTLGDEASEKGLREQMEVDPLWF